MPESQSHNRVARHPLLRELRTSASFVLIALVGSWLSGGFLWWMLGCMTWLWARCLFHGQHLVVLSQGESSWALPRFPGLWQELAQRLERTRKRNRLRWQHHQLLRKKRRELINALPYAMVLLNADKHILWSNDKALQVLGIDHRSDQGLRIENLIRNPRFLAHLRQAMDTEPVYEWLEMALWHQQRSVLMQLTHLEDGSLMLVARKPPAAQVAD